MRLKRCVAVSLALLAIAVSGAVTSCKCEGEKAAAAKESGGQPKIVAVEQSFDFGKVKQGATVEHIFKIRNAGTAELKIEKARGS